MLKMVFDFQGIYRIQIPSEGDWIILETLLLSLNVGFGGSKYLLRRYLDPLKNGAVTFQSMFPF